MKGSFSSPFPQGLSYFACEWDHRNPDQPIKFWYEINEDGCCLRQVELYRDGRLKVDAVANYPDGATEFGFGTLHGASFWESEWDDEADSFGESTKFLALSKRDFDAIWMASVE